jgi:predicted RNase H-like nuclease (RuvC/YqgF family)
VNNINENKEEFESEVSNIKLPLAAYFKKFGRFPHQPKGTEVIISNENASLKEKIKDLQAENEVLLSQINELKGTNELLQKKLKSIEDIVLFNDFSSDEA